MSLENVDIQPYFASVGRAIETMERAGQPVTSNDRADLISASDDPSTLSISRAEGILRRYTLFDVEVEADGFCSSHPGSAPRTLIEQGWKLFLLRIYNAHRLQGRFDVVAGGFLYVAGATPGRMTAPNLEQRPRIIDTIRMEPLLDRMWIDARLPTNVMLSGATLEYLPLSIFSQRSGVHSTKFAFGVGDLPEKQFSRAAAAWASTHQPKVDFDCAASLDVSLVIRDFDGAPCTASLTWTDIYGNVYPPRPMRTEPDMAFHSQIYRMDGESVRLPIGTYSVTSWRGPEYLKHAQPVSVTKGRNVAEVRLERWINPADYGWYPGDVHIHAAGCSHFMHPSQGVSPETIIRQVRGEGLAVGQVLTWGPAWDYQSRFFCGEAVSPDGTIVGTASAQSSPRRASRRDGESLIRYDVEISGFPSSHSGHLMLLGLKTHRFNDLDALEDWPSWNLPIAKWAKAQGAIVGYAHCGFGMGTRSVALPNFDIPPFDSVGTNEAIVDITHGAMDFLAGCELHPSQELNSWYHLLNCGFRPAMLGETDYPCISDERPGMGRSYVRLETPPVGDDGYCRWLRGLQAGKVYSGDGRTHFLSFDVDGHRQGDPDVALGAPSTVVVNAIVTALLSKEITPDVETIIRSSPFSGPCWHVERARKERRRAVSLEIIRNGLVVKRFELKADGTPNTCRFEMEVSESSWIALRVLPSGHTHPIFVNVDGKPVRASRRSARWLRECVDALWHEKCGFVRPSEVTTAAAAYDHARYVYDAIAEETTLP